MSVLVVAVMLVISACTSGGDGSAEPSDPTGPDTTTSVPPALVLAPSIERLPPPDDSPLLVGADDRVTIGGTGSDGDVALVAGTRRTASGNESFLIRTEDGETWSDVTPDGFSGVGPFLGGIVRTDEAFVVTATSDVGTPLAHVSADGTSFETFELAFPETTDPTEGVILETTVTDGETVLALGERVEILADAGTFGSRIVASLSDDHGETWRTVPLPEPFFVPDQTFREASAAVHDDRIVVAADDDSGSTAFWESDDHGDTWERRGTATELLGTDALSPVVHLDEDGLVVAATTERAPDADLAFWSETTEGFERADVPEEIFGGDGQQLASRIETVNGVLTITGRTTQPFHAVHGRTVLEVWFRVDGEWKRTWDEPAMRLQEASLEVADVAVLGGELLITATEQRDATIEEVEAFEADPPQPGQPVTNPPPARRQIGAVLALSFEEIEDTDGDTEITMVESDSFGGDGDQEMTDIAIGADGTVVVVGEVSDGEEETDGAVWVSEDLIEWSLVESDALGGPGSQSISAIVATSDGFVAVGDEYVGNSNHTALAWRSTDGRTWERSAPTVPEAETGAFYGAGMFQDVVYAVGERYQPAEGTYRVPLVMRSQDSGATWETVEAEVFGARPIEVLRSVDVIDGRLLVGGHVGDPTDLDNGGFQYTPEPVVRSSDDGSTWTAEPVSDGWIGQTLGVVDLGNGPTAFGNFIAEPGTSARGLASIDGAGSATDVPGTPLMLSDAIVDPAIGVGSVLGPNTDGEAAIALLDDDGVRRVLRGPGLVADGDQAATAVVRVDDRIVVIGRSSDYGSDDDAAVWILTGPEAEGAS